MIHLKQLLEAVPIGKADVIQQRLEKKLPSLTPGTFGIDLEYRASFEKFNAEDYKDEIVGNMLLPKNWNSNRDIYREWLDINREHANRNYNWRGRDWDDEYGPVDVDTWDYAHPEPVEADYEDETDFQREYGEWKDARSDVEWTYNKWERRDWSDKATTWAEEMVDSGDWEQYSDYEHPATATKEQVAIEITEARGFIESEIGDSAKDEFGSQNSWGVGQDASADVEIRTKHLTQTELGKVSSILRFIADKKTDGDTSAHVHVGLPENFNAFDIIAMSDLVDEPQMKQVVGSDRNFKEWAALNYDLAGDILAAIKNSIPQVAEKGIEVSMDSLMEILKKTMRRHRGTNLYAFFQHKTIEFRYFSSDAAKRHPDTFIKWIQYFMVLPKVAQVRNKIVVGPGRAGALVFTRLGGDKVKIELEEKLKAAIQAKRSAVTA